MRDRRWALDSVQLAWLHTLERIMGTEAEVAIGYEGEPLFFRWAGHTHGYHLFEISFDDDDHVSFHWMNTLPMREVVMEDGGIEYEYDERPYDESHNVAFGRVPQSMVREMKRFRVYLENQPKANEVNDA